MQRPVFQSAASVCYRKPISENPRIKPGRKADISRVLKRFSSQIVGFPLMSSAHTAGMSKICPICKKTMTANNKAVRASMQFAGDPEPTISDFTEGRLFSCECGHKVGSPDQQHDGRRRLYSLDGVLISG
jgi:hypothetical protein